MLIFASVICYIVLILKLISYANREEEVEITIVDEPEELVIVEENQPQYSMGNTIKNINGKNSMCKHGTPKELW